MDTMDLNSFDIDASESALVHERFREAPVKRWVLLDGNRYTIIAILSGLVFAICFGIGMTGLIPVQDPGTATTLVAAIVGGTLPFITIVLAINQLVLSQELGWPDELITRFEGMTTLRRDVETLTDVPVSPAAPADFLRLLMAAIIDNAETLDTMIDGDTTLERFIRSITADAREVSETLETASLGTFDALSAVLGHFNGVHLYSTRRLQAQDNGSVPNEGIESIETLTELLEHLSIARQTFKTLYMQYELAHLSKVLLYVGFPTLLGGGIFMMTYPRIIESFPDPLVLIFVVSIVVTLAFLPFIVLLVYTFRIATVASRTADFGPFVPRAALETQ